MVDLEDGYKIEGEGGNGEEDESGKEVEVNIQDQSYCPPWDISE